MRYRETKACNLHETVELFCDFINSTNEAIIIVRALLLLLLLLHVTRQQRLISQPELHFLFSHTGELVAAHD
jgi:hypothetical protein